MLSRRPCEALHELRRQDAHETGQRDQLGAAARRASRASARSKAGAVGELLPRHDRGRDAQLRARREARRRSSRSAITSNYLRRCCLRGEARAMASMLLPRPEITTATGSGSPRHSSMTTPRVPRATSPMTLAVSPRALSSAQRRVRIGRRRRRRSCRCRS